MDVISTLFIIHSKLNLSYTAKDAGGSIETCTAVAIKK
jgi:hypothetical protein